MYQWLCEYLMSDDCMRPCNSQLHFSTSSCCVASALWAPRGRLPWPTIDEKMFDQPSWNQKEQGAPTCFTQLCFLSNCVPLFVVCGPTAMHFVSSRFFKLVPTARSRVSLWAQCPPRQRLYLIVSLLLPWQKIKQQDTRSQLPFWPGLRREWETQLGTSCDTSTRTTQWPPQSNDVTQHA